jgi:hypothetical protein
VAQLVPEFCFNNTGNNGVDSDPFLDQLRRQTLGQGQDGTVQSTAYGRAFRWSQARSTGGQCQRPARFDDIMLGKRCGSYWSDRLDFFVPSRERGAY